MRGTRIAGPVALVGLIAATGLGAAAVAYEASAGAHGEVATAQGPPGWLAPAVDYLGVALAVILVAGIMLGYGFVSAARHQRRAHDMLAWPILGVTAVHGAGAVWHISQPPVESAPMWIATLGTLAAAVIAGQLLEARHRRTRGAGPRRKAPDHALVGLIVGGLVIAHVTLATLHVLSG